MVNVDSKPRNLQRASELGTVETQFAEIRRAGGFELSCGLRLPAVKLAYECYGELNAARDNAVLVFHALTGSQHAAGTNTSVPGVEGLWTEECHLGWWNEFIGPGRPLDTDRFCVLCVNYLGGCYGTTGPTSVCPSTGERYGGSFPKVSFADTARSQVALLDELGIDRLHAILGPSTGGMACLSLATLFPERVDHVVLIATGLQLTPLQRIHNFEQIRAIENDPEFRGGCYDIDAGPKRGLALARMISHKTFVSLQSMRRRSRQAVEVRPQAGAWYEINDPLESYMVHQGSKFAQRFDANAYLRILDAWNHFDLVAEAGTDSLIELFSRCREQRYLIFSIDSDVCYYPEEQDEIARLLDTAGVACLRVTVHSDKGHDSFLVEPELFAPHLFYTLNR